jgi:DNA-binding XRE family transcriptional regulator
MGRGPSDGDALHNRIAVLRAEHGMSRKELAEAVGVHYRTIGYLERGEYSPSLALAFRIARFFDLPLEAVFSDRPFSPLSAQVYGGRAAGRTRDD